jgi:hypothetical protein
MGAGKRTMQPTPRPRRPSGRIADARGFSLPELLVSMLKRALP